MKKIFSILIASLMTVGLMAEKVYFINTPGWAAVKVHAWDGPGAVVDWPGHEMTKLDDQIQGFDVYEFSADAGDYAHIIFNNAVVDQQTVDLDWNADKYYIWTGKLTGEGKLVGEWFAEGDIPTIKVIKQVAVAGAFNEWNAEADILELATDELTASVTLSLEAEDYQFKMVVGGNWVTKMEGLFDLHRNFNSIEGVNFGGGPGDNFVLKCDIAGDYVFTWTFAEERLTVTFPEKPEPVLANGFYLIGKINGDAPAEWNYDALKAENILVKNELASTEEYMISTTLAEGDEFQIVRCDDDQLGDWFPGGTGNNYVVDAAHAGDVAIYFRPLKDGDDGWWHNEILVVPADPQSISNTVVENKAIKSMVNGQLLIIKGDKVFDATGTQIQ